MAAVNLLIGTIAAFREAPATDHIASAGSSQGQNGRPSPRADGSGSESTPSGATDPTIAGVGESTTTTIAGQPDPGGADGTGGGGSVTATTPPGGLSCQNSHDSACGDFSWMAAPANTPLQWHVTYEPAEPQVGQAVTFHVTVADDESRVGPGFECYSDHACSARTDFGEWGPPGYGPWSLPVHPSSATYDYSHTFASPGTYTASFGVSAYAYGYQVDCPGDPGRPVGGNGFDCRDPYLEFAVAGARLTVRP